MSSLDPNLNSSKSVALISMPFYVGDAVPNLAISTLKGSLVQENIQCDNYYFDEISKGLIGWSLYYILSTLAYAGEWFFAASAFEGFTPESPIKPSFMENNSYNFNPEIFTKILKETHDRADEIIESLYSKANWDSYSLVGFSTTFYQNTASLALARRIKERHPNTRIVFGGGNCDGIMGLTMHKQFPYIDYVIRGDGDFALPTLAKQLIQGEKISNIAGLIYRNEAGESITNDDKTPTIIDLDQLPFPNFQDFVRDHKIDKDINFPVEFSRGCWWGEKNHCVFCGLNGYNLEFRAKSPDRIFEELDFLSKQYAQNSFQVVDNILKQDFFNNLIPRIITKRPEWSFFFEVKANLKKEQIKLLSKANVRFIQPGIESLSNDILKLMNKGVTGIQNIQLLKWCNEFGIIPNWIWLSGFPSEDPKEYKRMEKMLSNFIHLKPPARHYLVRMDRFSNLFEQAEKFGLKNVRPAHQYASIYPFSEKTIFNLVNLFDFDYPNGEDPAIYTESFSHKITDWIDGYAPGTLSSITIGDVIFIFENRPNKEKKKIMLSGLEKNLYEYCDRGHSFRAIFNQMQDIGWNIEKDQLREILIQWEKLGLIFSDNDWHLSLAVARDEYVNPVSDSEVIKLILTEIITELSEEIL